MKHYFSIIVLLLASAIICQSQTRTTFPEDWQKVAACGATFYLPKDMILMEGVFGMDNCAKVFVSKTLRLKVTTGAISTNPRHYVDQMSDLAGESNFKRARTKIRGRGAVIVTYYDSDDGGGGYGFNHKMRASIAARGGFSMSFDLEGSEEGVIAEKIIRSIAFPQKKSRY